MQHDYRPTLVAARIESLRPTQMTVGYREVALKRAEWCRKREKAGGEFLGRHMIPVVLGPKERLWLVDHHHLARALFEEGELHVLTSIVADLSHLHRDEFLTVMDNRSWLHPFDDKGVRRGYAKLPKSIDALDDDPCRSLAGELRRTGGFAKSQVPFTEFLWADYLRRRIDKALIHADFDKALSQAKVIAHDKDARHLPGWVGPDD